MLVRVRNSEEKTRLQATVYVLPFSSCQWFNEWTLILCPRSEENAPILCYVSAFILLSSCTLGCRRMFLTYDDLSVVRRARFGLWRRGLRQPTSKTQRTSKGRQSTRFNHRRKNTTRAPLSYPFHSQHQGKFNLNASSCKTTLSLALSTSFFTNLKIGRAIS